MTDLFNHFPIGFKSPDAHDQEKCKEDRKGTERINVYTNNIFEVVNEFHGS
jgi:hypothetical protein